MYICGFISIFQDALEVCLQKKLPLALARGKIKLVVIDSVAALFRCHYDNKNLVVRAKHLASLATQLRQLADRYNTAVICVNQVRLLGICLHVLRSQQSTWRIWLHKQGCCRLNSILWLLSLSIRSDCFFDFMCLCCGPRHLASHAIQFQ